MNDTKCNKSSAVAESGDRLATIDMSRKVGRGCCAPFRGGSWVLIRGVATGGYIGIYTLPKSVPGNYFVH